MENLTKNQIIQRAIGISRGSYVDAIRLAENLEVDVYGVDEKDDFNSKIVYDKEKGKYAIYVNIIHPITRQRFSIAHDLAHLVLHPDEIKAKGGLNREERIGNKTKEQEEAADELAEEILMPKELVDKYLKENNIDKTIKIDSSLIIKIADYFKVSKIVATIRLRNLRFYVPFISFS